jgi:hypothetical protein
MRRDTRRQTYFSSPGAEGDVDGERGEANYVESAGEVCVGAGVNQVPYIPSARCGFLKTPAAFCSLIRLKLLLNCSYLLAPIPRTKVPVLLSVSL